MREWFNSVFASDAADTVSVGIFVACVGVALFTGVLYWFAFSYRMKSSGSLRAALFFLPAVVAVTIMMVNGNVGVGVAVAGAFSLVRFRSAPGTAREIAAIFMAMCSGLIVGVGYLAFAVLFTVIMCAALLLAATVTERKKNGDRCRRLKVTIPEDLDFDGVFDDIFGEFTDAHTLVAVKTANMGSLYKLTYDVIMKNGVSEKTFTDSLRVRNGNLEIMLSRCAEDENSL